MILAFFLLCASAVAEPATEIRGTWLTTTANDALATPANTARTMKRLREIGLNTAYVECWKNGYTEFPSETLRRATGVSHKLNLPDQPPERDLLREAVEEAHRNNLKCFAWFEYGFIAAAKGTDNELVRKADWLSRDIHGDVLAHNGFVWLNPLHPEVQELLIGIATDAVKNYEIDGLQFDDRFSWPGTEMGYDAYTRGVFAAEHGGADPPENPYEKLWVRWRADKVSDFARRFAIAIHKANPRVILSLSPAPYPFSYDVYMCDWPTWVKWDGASGVRWDQIVPQCYRRDYKSFDICLREQIAYMGDRRSDFVAAIRLVGDGPDLAAGDATKCATAARGAGIGGHCWWFSRGVLGSFHDEIAQIYAGVGK